MDGLLESGFITQLGPYGTAVLALVACYFLWQRQTQQFSDLKVRMEQLIAGVQTNETERRAAATAMTDQNTKFQLEMASNRPTRDEMNNALDRMAGTMKDIVGPMRDDLQFIKEAILKGNQK